MRAAQARAAGRRHDCFSPPLADNVAVMASSLRKRILSGYGVSLALMAVVLVWAVANLVSLGQASDAILRENYQSILAAENMIGAIERQDSATLLVMLDYEDEGLVQFGENKARFLNWLDRARRNITVPGEADIVKAIETGYDAYLDNFSHLRQMRGQLPQQAGKYYHETVLPSFKGVRDEAARLREINQKAMESASRRAKDVAHTAIWSTVAVAAAAIALGLALGLLLSKRLVRPISQMMRATEALAEENYDVQVPAGGSDELGRLAESFNAMASKLGVYHRMNVEQILAEKRKSDAVLRSIEDGVVVVDAEFRVTNMNPQAGRMLGADPDAAAEKHFLEVVKDERLFELMKQTAESGRPPIVEEGKNIISIGEDESARHYMFGITPVIAKGGRMLGVVLLLRDVTRLKELDRMKSEFVMTASHELKTPLQSLGMSIELLREGAADKLDARQRQLLDAASEELARLRSLISDLLDLSKIEAGKVVLELDRIAPGILAEKAVGVFKTQARENNIDLAADVPEDVPEVRADANKITWVLTNLIANALRYADSRIAVSARHVGQWVHLSVADDGEGIPPEHQSRIFEKFVQIKSPRSVGGTGLGLAICKEIVRAHKGTIWVDSTPGKGSAFTFTLPVAQQT
jgi:NtrC-family two-component system sensor histidine kinase KinB